MYQPVLVIITTYTLFPYQLRTYTVYVSLVMQNIEDKYQTKNTISWIQHLLLYNICDLFSVESFCSFVLNVVNLIFINRLVNILRLALHEWVICKRIACLAYTIIILVFIMSLVNCRIEQWNSDLISLIWWYCRYSFYFTPLEQPYAEDRNCCKINYKVSLFVYYFRYVLALCHCFWVFCAENDSMYCRRC